MNSRFVIPEGNLRFAFALLGLAFPNCHSWFVIPEGHLLLAFAFALPLHGAVALDVRGPV